ncbi:MAG: hypothetical protein ACK5VR_18770, partial [Burkholderiales bacterium]
MNPTELARAPQTAERGYHHGDLAATLLDAGEAETTPGLRVKLFFRNGVWCRGDHHPVTTRLNGHAAFPPDPFPMR